MGYCRSIILRYAFSNIGICIHFIDIGIKFLSAFHHLQYRNNLIHPYPYLKMIRSRLSALEAHDPTYLWKFIVRALAALLSLTGVALAGHALAASLHDPNDNSMVPRQYSSYKHWRHYYDLNLYLPWLFIPLSLSILWNGTNIAAYVVRTKSLQPVANFISDLLLGLGLLATGIYAAFPAARFIHFTLEEYGRVFGRTWSLPRNRSSTYNQTNTGPLGVEFLTPSNVTGQVCAGLLVDDCTATLQLVKGYNIKGRVIMAGCVTAYIVL